MVAPPLAISHARHRLKQTCMMLTHMVYHVQCDPWCCRHLHALWGVFESILLNIIVERTLGLLMILPHLVFGIHYPWAALICPWTLFAQCTMHNLHDVYIHGAHCKLWSYRHFHTLCRFLWVYFAPYACGEEFGIVEDLTKSSARHEHCTCAAVMCSMCSAAGH